MNESAENPYAISRHKVQEAYRVYLSGAGEGLFVTVSTSTLTANAHTALERTAEALGYGKEGTAFLTVDAAEPTLSPTQLLAVIEGLDPLCIVICDKETVSLCAQTYRQDIPIARRIRLFGRDACAFDDLSGLIAYEQGKQQAWHLLKQLPKRP